MVDKQNALQVVHLVLDTGRKQALRVDLSTRALLVEIADLDPGRAGDLGELVGQGQAALLARGEFLTGGDEFRIDEYRWRRISRLSSDR